MSSFESSDSPGRFHSFQKESGAPQASAADECSSSKKNSGHEWPKRLLWLISFCLKTGDSTDTVDRLFGRLLREQRAGAVNFIGDFALRLHATLIRNRR
jgi:hypothetical protein